MTFMDDAEYCATVVTAANKYNKYGINIADEVDYIKDMEEELTYNVTKSESDEILLTNRVFLMKHICIKLCRDELGSDANLELFDIIKSLYTVLGETIIRCHQRDPERYEYMDKLAFQKAQVEFVLDNCSPRSKVIYSLLLSEIDYIIRKYCKHEFIEVKDRPENN